MEIERTYESLPFYWERETLKNDRRWLESIVRNAAPFSDWWTKARIVQLAYIQPPNVPSQTIYGLPTYGAYQQEQAIAEALRSTCDLNEYREFAKQVNEDYVIRTLNSWHNKQFTQAISRNFEVFVNREYSNIFLLVSTAPTSLNVDRKLPSMDKYRPLFNIAEMGIILRSQNFKRITLRTHGYSTPAEDFYKAFDGEAEALCLKGPINSIGTLEDQSAYIGYNWPGEQPFVAPGLWRDARYNGEIFLKFLLTMALLAWLAGTVLYFLSALAIVPLLQILGLDPILDPIWAWFNFSKIGSLIVQWQIVAFVVFVLWLLLMQILRLVVYQRDRYRAIHYGAPDLGEFFWRLDKVLGENPYISMPFDPNTQPNIPVYRSLKVNLIGHSMGALVLVNVLRILSDKFGKDERIEEEKTQMGEYLILNKLILSGPDIPLELLREGRNNYVRSAIQRCQEIYLFSSDRDIVLRYLSLVGNWFSEPSLEMSGLRLGNVYLNPVNSPENSREYRPYIRVLLNSLPAVEPTSAYDLFEKFNYLDCSRMIEVNTVDLKLNPWNGLIIDAINTVAHFREKIDVHSGYYRVQTPSFDLLKFLITREDFSRTETIDEINRLIANTPIRFLPSQPFMSRGTR
ncbi:alpha/beta hydrolase [Capilliphycus salinus ALCB114379]|uniref:alpha/beta hydrolase n=1 Tax=Capilliphycus salinus TaxID=2768948 RepID=UPI0039A5CC16